VVSVTVDCALYETAGIRWTLKGGVQGQDSLFLMTEQ
jgi:hypothetical protein